MPEYSIGKDMTAEYEHSFSIDRMVDKFEDRKISSKIRKIKLLEEAGLPTPKIDCFSNNEIKNLEDKIVERLQAGEAFLGIRVACIPDVYSMPSFHIKKNTNIDEVKDWANNLLEKEPAVTDFILSESTPEGKAKNKISGRILLEDKNVAPREVTIELYKGARSTSILNNVDRFDPNYQRFEKKNGELIQQVTKLSDRSSITEKDIKEINEYLEKYKMRMKNVKEVIAKSQNKDFNDMVACFEFTYIDGEFKFIDID